MLIEFQQAFADLVATPSLCVDVRKDPVILKQRYRLSDREWRRLVRIVNDRGMECNCMLYRANRLAPIALNLGHLCAELGDHLAPLLHEYWDTHNRINAHFLLECVEFCQFLLEKSTSKHALPQNLIALINRSLYSLNSRIEQHPPSDV